MADISYRMNPNKCCSCSVDCEKICPNNAIVWVPAAVEYVAKIIQSKCRKCGKCYEACKWRAIDKFVDGVRVVGK